MSYTSKIIRQKQGPISLTLAIIVNILGEPPITFRLDWRE